MADTLVDAVEPVPPTQRDPEGPPPAAQPPRSSGLRPLIISFIAMLVLGLAVGTAVWSLVFRYQPTALAHVPAGSNVVVRIEAADIVLFGPVRNNLLPLLLEDKPKETALNKVPFVERLQDRTGVRLPVDVREVLVATMDGKNVVAILGGKISRGKFVSGLAEIAKEENWPGFRLEEEVLVGPNVAVGQADDGTIIVGTNRAIVMTALPATDEGSKMGLPDLGAVRFVIAKQAWENVANMGRVVPEAGSFAKVRRGTGSFTLGTNPELVLRLEPEPGVDSATIEKGAADLLANMRLLMMLAPDRFGEKEALRQAVVSRDGAQVVVRAPWPYEGLEQGSAVLAARIRAFGAAEPGPLPPSP
jgi:hypothetical protein